MFHKYFKRLRWTRLFKQLSLVSAGYLITFLSIFPAVIGWGLSQTDEILCTLNLVPTKSHQRSNNTGQSTHYYLLEGNYICYYSMEGNCTPYYSMEGNLNHFLPSQCIRYCSMEGNCTIGCVTFILFFSKTLGVVFF